jgi:hypothetical protein
MKRLLFALLLSIGLPASVGADSLIFGNDGANLCVTSTQGLAWMHQSWERRAVFIDNQIPHTVWARPNSTQVMITYLAFVKIFEGRLLPMLCQGTAR